jgi:cobalt-zinc-cadmium efflux system membrane fusion protein
MSALIAKVGWAAALAGVLAGSGCESKPKTSPTASADPTVFEVPKEQRTRLDVIAVGHTPVSRPLHVPAVVSFDDLTTTDVVPLVSGRVEKVMVHEGARVRAGDALLSIASTDSSDNAANLKRDQATLQNKQTILTRDLDLYVHKAISLEEMEGAQLDVASAKASLEDDEEHVRITGTGVSHALLASPITGLVVARHVAVGQAVQAGGDPVFTITDPSLVWVIAHVYPEDVRRVALRDRAVIHSPALEDPVEGKVTYIGAAIDADTLTVPIRIEVENRRGALKKGLYVDSEIYPAREESLQTLPDAALLRDSDNLPFVYVATGEGLFTRRHVSIGDRVGEGTIILDGLKDGERVLTSGALFVQFADSLEH